MQMLLANTLHKTSFTRAVGLFDLTEPPNLDFIIDVAVSRLDDAREDGARHD